MCYEGIGIRHVPDKPFTSLGTLPLFLWRFLFRAIKTDGGATRRFHRVVGRVGNLVFHAFHSPVGTEATKRRVAPLLRSPYGDRAQPHRVYKGCAKIEKGQKRERKKK